MGQLALFEGGSVASVDDGVPVRTTTKRRTSSIVRYMARRGDPESSFAAARDMVDSGKREADAMLVLQLVNEYPGLTSKELSEKTPVLDRFQIARRLPDIERHGLIHRTKEEHDELRWWPGRGKEE